MPEDFAVLALRADTRGLKTGEDALNSLVKTGAKTEAAVGAQAGRMRDAMGRYAKGAQQAETATVKMASGIGVALGRLAAAGAAAFSVRALVNMTNQYTSLVNMLRVASDGQGDVNAQLAALADISRQTRAPLEAMATVYQRASMAADQLGASQSELMEFTKNVGLALAQQGGSAASASGALLQLSQTLGAGTVRAEEFNSILEGAFPIAQAAARGIDEAGGSVARLRQLVIEGKISSDEFFNAILSQSDQLAATFAQTTPTISQAFGVLTDQLMLTVGAFDQTVGVSAAVASAMLFVGDNLERIAVYAGVAAAAFAISMAPALLAAAVAAGRLVIGLVATRAALIRTGIGALVVLAGELVYQFIRLVDGAKGFGNAMNLLGAVAAEVWQHMADGASALSSAVYAVGQEITAAWASALASMRGSWIDFLSAVSGGAAMIPGMGDVSAALMGMAAQASATQVTLERASATASENARVSWGLSRELMAMATEPVASIGALTAALGATGDAAAGSTTDVTGLGNAATEAGGKAKTAAKEAADALLEKVGGAIDEISGAFGDWVTSGFKDFQGFMRKIEDTFKQTISDMIATAIANPIKLAMGITTGTATPAMAGTGGGGILGSLTSQIGGLGTAFWGGLSGVGSGLLSGGLSGGMSAITGSLAGLSGGGLAGFAGALGALAAPLAAVAALVSFFTTKTKLLDSGLRVTVHGFDTAVQTFQKIEKSRFWGLSKSVNTKYGSASASVSDPIGAAVGDIQTAVMEAAGVLGIAEAAFDGFSYQLKLSTKGLSKDEAIAKLQTKLEGMGDAFAGMIPGLTELQKEGEGAQDTLDRLSKALTAVNLVTDTLGLTFKAIGLTGADVASQLADAFGGLDTLTSATTAYYNAFYTDAERAETATRQATAALAELGAAMPTTRDQYRAMIEAQDLTTEAGRDLFAALVGLSGVMDTVLPKVSNITAALAALVGTTQTGVDAMISATDTAQSNALAAAKAWYATAKSLREFLAEMRGTASAMITPAQALASNQARFQMLLAQALAGNQDAADALTGAATNLLDSTNSTAGTAFEAAKAQARVMSDLQLAAGAADISGGAQDVVADLLGKQNTILRRIRDYLAGGGVLDPDDIDGLNAQLASLQDAIGAAQATTYAALKARIDIAVDLIETADIPKSLRRMLDSAATGITADLDFIVRAENVSPAVKFLALNNTSEHISTVEFLAKHPTVPRDVFNLALSTTGKVAKTVNFVIGSDLSDSEKQLALAASSELTRTINAVIPEARRDAPAVRLALATASGLTRFVDAVLTNGAKGSVALQLGLATASDLTRTIGAAFAKGIDRDARMLALSTGGLLTRTVNAAIKDGRADAPGVLLAMATSSSLARSVTAVLGSGGSDQAIKVALAQTAGLTRSVVAQIGTASQEKAMRVALATSSALTQTIAATLAATSDPKAMNLALAVGGSLIRNIRAALDDKSGPRALDLALAQNSALVRSIKARLDGDSSNDAEAIALSGNSLLVRTIKAAMGNRDATAIGIALGTDSELVRSIIAQLADGKDPDAIALALGVSSDLVRKVKAQMGGVDAKTLALALGTDSTLTRNVVALLGAKSGNNAIAIALGMDSDLVRTIRAKIAAGQSDRAIALALGVDSALVREVRATLGKVSAEALAWATASNSAITKTVNAAVDFSKLSANKKAFLDAITGSATGTITLGGSFLFNPTDSFKSWYETATQAGIADPLASLASPMSELQLSLSKLSAAIRANTAAIVTPTTPVDPGTGGGTDNAAAIAAAQANGLSLLEDLTRAQQFRDRMVAQYGSSEAGAGIIRESYRNVVGLNKKLTSARAEVTDLGGVPAFATGGAFIGGLRIVGENGPELEATGPARYYSAPQTRDMLGRDDGALVAELQALRKEVAGLREEQRQLGMTTATSTKKSADIHRKWDIDGLPAVRT